MLSVRVRGVFHRHAHADYAELLPIAPEPDGGSVIVSSHDNGLLTRIDLEKQTPVTACDGGAGIEVLTFY